MKNFLFLIIFILNWTLSSSSLYASEQNLSKALHSIIETCESRIQENNRIFKEILSKYMSSKDPKQKQDLDTYGGEIVHFREMKTLAQTILTMVASVAREELIDQLREKFRVEYIYNLKKYTGFKNEISEAAHYKKMFLALGPFISFTQKCIETRLDLVLKGNYFTYRLDPTLSHVDRFLGQAKIALQPNSSASTVLKEKYYTYLLVHKALLNESIMDKFYKLWYKLFKLEIEIENELSIEQQIIEKQAKDSLKQSSQEKSKEKKKSKDQTVIPEPDTCLTLDQTVIPEPDTCPVFDPELDTCLVFHNEDENIPVETTELKIKEEPAIQIAPNAPKSIQTKPTKCTRPKAPSREERRLDTLARIINKITLLGSNKGGLPGDPALAAAIAIIKNPNGDFELLITTKSNLNKNRIFEVLQTIFHNALKLYKTEDFIHLAQKKREKFILAMLRCKNFGSDGKEISLNRLTDLRYEIDLIKLANLLFSQDEENSFAKTMRMIFDQKAFHILENPQGFHPELVIAEHFILSKIAPEEVYIGVNILNCRKCATMLEGEKSNSKIRIIGINEVSKTCFRSRGSYDLGYPNTYIPAWCSKANVHLGQLQIRDRLDALGIPAKKLSQRETFLKEYPDLSDSEEENNIEPLEDLVQANLHSIADIRRIQLSDASIHSVETHQVPDDGDCGFTSLRSTRKQYVKDLLSYYKSSTNKSSINKRFERFKALVNAMLNGRNIDEWAQEYERSHEWMNDTHMHIFSSLYNVQIHFYTADTYQGGTFIPLIGDQAVINETDGHGTNAHLLWSSYAPTTVNSPIAAFNHYDELLIGDEEPIEQGVQTTPQSLTPNLNLPNNMPRSYSSFF